jgi:hypothetical protein
MNPQIQLLVQDLNKQHAKYKKLYHKYSKLVKDAEVSIKAREEAIIQYAAKVNRTEKEAHSQDVTSYLNRGLNKMISKIIPTEDFKTIHDRCRSLLSEMEDVEVNLTMQSDQLNVLHTQLQEKAQDMTKQIELLEAERLGNTKDGLLRFCQASEGMLEHNKNILEQLRGLTIAAAAAAEESVNSDEVSGGGLSEDMVSLDMELTLLVNIMRDTDFTYGSSNDKSTSNSSSRNNSNQSVAELVNILSEERDNDKPKYSSTDLELSIEIHLHSFEKLKSALSILGNMNYQVLMIHFCYPLTYILSIISYIYMVFAP